MLPFLLILALFLFLTAVGLAVVTLLRPRLGVLWSWFLAPTVGLSLVIVIMTRINIWGIPVKTFGPWLAVALAVFAVAVFWWRRPILPWRQLRPFALLTVLYVVYAGWPMFRFGFNWISYANDDMANYCLAADRFLNHGYYDLPEQTELEGRDYTEHYWFMHGLQQIRPGSEMMLAFTSSVTRLNPHEVFMPVIFMFSMLQICAMGAVAMFRGRYRKIALLAFFLFATSPLFALGTLYQLIAQVGGMAILFAACAVLLNTRECTWRRVLLGSLLTACLGIFYPEVAPFVAISIIFFGLHLRYVNPGALKPFSLVVAGTAILTFIFLGTSTYQFINTLVMQSVGSAGLGSMAEINDQSGGLVLFPWTLVPSFVPMLFGLHAFGVVGFDPLISIQIAVGLLFLVFFIWMAFGQMSRREPAGYIAVIMIALGFFLFFKGQDFGLFKLAMFAQPAITLLLAHEFYKLLSSPRWRKVGRWTVAIFFVCTVPSQVYYSFASLGTYGGGLSEIVGGSEYGVHFTPPHHEGEVGGVQRGKDALIFLLLHLRIGHVADQPEIESTVLGVDGRRGGKQCGRAGNRACCDSCHDHPPCCLDVTSRSADRQMRLKLRPFRYPKTPPTNPNTPDARGRRAANPRLCRSSRCCRFPARRRDWKSSAIPRRSVRPAAPSCPLC